MATTKEFYDFRTNLFHVDPVKIVVKPGLNARDLTTPDNVAHIRELADRIKEDGCRKEFPMKLAQIDGEFVVVAGHCRHAAIMLLREEGHVIESVPYVMEERGVSAESRIASQRAENSGSKPLTPLEEGYNVKRLMGLGLTIDQVAKRTGRSGTYVEQLLALQAAPGDIREMVKNKEIGAKTAIDTLRTEGETEGADILRETVAEAKAKGKKKAAPKDIQAKIEARDEAKRFRTAWKPKSGLLGVRIGNVEHSFGPDVWLKMAEKIVTDARKIIADQAAALQAAEDEARAASEREFDRAAPVAEAAPQGVSA